MQDPATALKEVEAHMSAGIDHLVQDFSGVRTWKASPALIDNLALLLEEKSIELPTPLAWPEGIEELEAFEYSVTDSGNVKMSAPGGQHDDCVAALGLAVWPLREARMPIQVW